MSRVRGLNPFGTGQCLTTLRNMEEKFQRLRLNPFGTGQCLTTKKMLIVSSRNTVSIPLEQGSVLRLFNNEHFLRRDRLNPFGTGQCLTTKSQNNIIEAVCLNPFGTGQCLTTKYVGAAILAGMSQSLWNRAVSYDKFSFNLNSSFN